MPIHLTQNEIAAVNIANQLKNLSSAIRQLKPESSRDKISDIRRTYQTLAHYPIHLLNKIHSEALASESAEIKNYYYYYLLLQISHFNHFFSKISDITDLRLEAEEKISAPEGITSRLEELGLYSFIHPLLNNSLPVQIAARVNNDKKVFHEHHVYHHEKNNPKYFYNEKTTPANKPHQDESFYFIANKEIGGATQISNARGLFNPAGQGKNAYCRPRDRSAHAREQALFKSAMRHIQNAEEITAEEREVLASGKYYRFPYTISFTVPKPSEDKSAAYKITHIGHASELITFTHTVPLTLVIDPVHYESGTQGLAKLAKIFYTRHTEAAFATNNYPATQIVLISHNHHDHLCFKSLTEAFTNTNTLFIVPLGDAKHFAKAGFTNVIEMKSWNDVVDITLTNALGEKSTYEIHGFPAKHASNRSLTDLYESLYMGFMIRDKTENKILLCTGDSAVLDKLHFDELESYLLQNNLLLHSACIPQGPDRPRKYMECTHQSTGDALVMHARLNMMNARNKAALELPQITVNVLAETACHAIGYHQGCFRLGLLSLSDVDATILRILAVLRTVNHIPLKTITPEILARELFYNFLDTFEKESVLQLIDVYKDVSDMTTENIIQIITTNVFIPQPGASVDFSLVKPHPGFEIEYLRLIQNQDPDLESVDTYSTAYEYFAAKMQPEKYMSNHFDQSELITHALEIYLDRPCNPLLKSNKQKSIREFLNAIPQINAIDLLSELGKLHNKIILPSDNSIRDEGHFQTLLLIIGCLIKDNSLSFRNSFAARHRDMTAALQPAQVGIQYG
jgi:L-ascorbate metabolism protein UlaG (beta-lactamase superfamily)